MKTTPIKCAQCEEEKTPSQFAINKAAKRLNRICKECVKANRKASKERKQAIKPMDSLERLAACRPWRIS